MAFYGGEKGKKRRRRVFGGRDNGTVHGRIAEERRTNAAYSRKRADVDGTRTCLIPAGVVFGTNNGGAAAAVGGVVGASTVDVAFSILTTDTAPAEYEEEESEAPAATELPDLQLVKGRRWLRADRIKSNNVPTKDQTYLNFSIDQQCKITRFRDRINNHTFIHVCSSYRTFALDRHTGVTHLRKGKCQGPNKRNGDGDVSGDDEAGAVNAISHRRLECISVLQQSSVGDEPPLPLLPVR
nr:hypothetical protein Iba_chr12aCG16990 [Ipomoea batatas]GMD71067.1 hypothetical protein Iba_chr12eCG12390 [Ipomoea batatas]